MSRDFLQEFSEDDGFVDAFADSRQFIAHGVA